MLTALALLVSANPAFAQEVESYSDVTLPLSVSVVGAESHDNRVLVSFKLNNQANRFIGEMEYMAQLFKGDSLAEVGYLFAPLEYMYTGVGTVDTLYPGESGEFIADFYVPNNLEAGNYFVRLIVEDEQAGLFGIDYTTVPFEINGEGGFIGGVEAYVNTPSGRAGLLEGITTFPGDDVSLIVPLDVPVNEKLSALVNSGKEIYADLNIESISFKGLLVHNGAPEKIKIENNAIVVPVSDTGERGPGAYDLVLSLVDEDGELITDKIIGRWFVGGLSARIDTLEVINNKYSKGDFANSPVYVNVGGYEKGDKVTVEAQFTFTNGEQDSFQEEFVLDGDDGEFVTLSAHFDNVKMTKEGSVSRFDARVINSEGEIVAQSFIDLDQEVIFQQDQSSALPLILLIGVLILLLIIILIIKKIHPKFDLKKIDPSTGVAVLILSASLVAGVVIVTPQSVLADHYVQSQVELYSRITSGDKTSDPLGDLSTLPSGDKGMCKNEEFGFNIYYKVSCAHCINKVNGDLRFFENLPSGDTSTTPTGSVHIDVDGSITQTGQGGTQDFGWAVKSVTSGGVALKQIDTNPITGAGSASHVFGPFSFKVGLPSDPNVAHGTVVSKDYLLWAQNTRGAGGGYCTASSVRTVDPAPLTCTQDNDICENLTGVQDHIPERGDVVFDTITNREYPITRLGLDVTDGSVPGKKICMPFEYPVIKPSCKVIGGDEQSIGDPEISFSAAGTTGGTNSYKYIWTGTNGDGDDFNCSEDGSSGGPIYCSGSDFSYEFSDPGTYTVDLEVQSVGSGNVETQYDQCTFTILGSKGVTCRAEAVSSGTDGVNVGWNESVGNVRWIATLENVSASIIDWNGEWINSSEENQLIMNTPFGSNEEGKFTNTIQIAESLPGGGYKSYSATCNFNIVRDDPPHEVSCYSYPSSRSLNQAENLSGLQIKTQWFGSVSGGEGPFTYTWKSPESSTITTGSVNAESVLYGSKITSGNKTATLTVVDQSNGVSVTKACSPFSFTVVPDLCSDVAGQQSTVNDIPSNRAQDGTGKCPLQSVCTLDGVDQYTVPVGYKLVGNQCVPKLSVSCSPISNPVQKNTPATFRASARSGDSNYSGNFTFEWSGINSGTTSSPPDPSVETAQATYPFVGFWGSTRVRVRDDSGSYSEYASCPVQVVDAPPVTPVISSYCSPSSADVAVNQQVTLNATYNHSGGSVPINYEWSGDKRLGQSGSVTRSYSAPGTYIVPVDVVDDDGNRNSNNNNYCTVEVAANETLGGTCSASPVNICLVNGSATANWEAFPTGGTGSYNYQWKSGASGTSKTTSTTYNSTGSYSVSVDIKDSVNPTATRSCSVTVRDSSDPMCGCQQDDPSCDVCMGLGNPPQSDPRVVPEGYEQNPPSIGAPVPGRSCAEKVVDVDLCDNIDGDQSIDFVTDNNYDVVGGSCYLKLDGVDSREI